MQEKHSPPLVAGGGAGGYEPPAPPAQVPAIIRPPCYLQVGLTPRRDSWLAETSCVPGDQYTTRGGLGVSRLPFGEVAVLAQAILEDAAQAPPPLLRSRSHPQPCPSEHRSRDRSHPGGSAP